MNRKTIFVAAISAFGSALWAQQPSGQQQAPQPMRFFVASTVPATGNLGGLAGADRICQNLAAAAGAGGRTWRAYLSAQAAGGQPAINARDRIGAGPWHNAKGVQIAPNIADLHGDDERDRNYLFKETALDEKGNVVNGRGDNPNVHDILTGSDSHGRALRGAEDRTCRNWTSDSSNDSAMVGHHDRSGGSNTSWNSVHTTPGCHADGLRKVGGGGRIYCFAIN